MPLFASNLRSARVETPFSLKLLYNTTRGLSASKLFHDNSTFKREKKNKPCSKLLNEHKLEKRYILFTTKYY
jgi:hypothetical protein